MSAPHPGDKSAAFTGLILGAIAIFVVCFAIVRLTSASFAGHSSAATGTPAPAATH